MQMQKFYIIPVLSILIVLAIGVLVIQPKVVEISDIMSKQESEKSRNQQLLQKRDQVLKLREQELEITAQQAELVNALPAYKNVTQFLLELDRLAQASNISIESVQAAPGILVEKRPTIGQAAEELTLNISIEGNFEAIKTFLQRVYKAKRLINATSLSIAINSETDNSVRGTGIFNIFYKRIPESPASVTEELPVKSEQQEKLFQELQTFTPYYQ